jgi:hypothetical protein
MLKIVIATDCTVTAMPALTHRHRSTLTEP